MADYDLSSIATDTDGPAADTEVLFGSPAAGTPKPYSYAGIKTWIKSWSDALYLDSASNLSDVADAPTAVVNLGAAPKFFKTYVAARYYVPMGYVVTGNATLNAANRIHFFPFYVPQKITISTLMLRTATGAAGNWQGAVYASHATTCLPTGTALANSAANATSVGNNTNIDSALASNVQLLPGVLYWMAINADSATPTYNAINSNNVMNAAAHIGSTANSDTIGLVFGGVTTNQTFGTWPDVTASSFVNVASGSIPLIGFKVASVP